MTVGARTTFRDITFGTAVGRVGGFRWNAVDADSDIGLGQHIGVLVAGRAAWRRLSGGGQIDFWPANVGLRFKI